MTWAHNSYTLIRHNIRIDREKDINNMSPVEARRYQKIFNCDTILKNDDKDGNYD